jgi:hypothetical protein
MLTDYILTAYLNGQLNNSEACSRLSSLLPLLLDHGLQPAPYAASAWNEGGQEIIGLTMEHREFAERTNDPMWGLTFTVLYAPEIGATTLRVMIPAGSGAAAKAIWHWTTELALDFCENLTADLGLVNGFGVHGKEGRGGTPAGPDVAYGGPLGALCPWMYWGAERLARDQSRELMSGLPAAVCKPTHRNGWVLQPWLQYSRKRPEALVKEYTSRFSLSKPARWLAI